MIFFNRHKKTGKDIGKSVRQTVLQAFQIYGKEPPKSVFLNANSNDCFIKLALVFFSHPIPTQSKGGCQQQQLIDLEVIQNNSSFSEFT